MTTDVLKGKWKQLKGGVRENWHKLTDDDIKRIDGKRERLEGVLQEKYGYTKQRARQEVDDYLNQIDGRMDDIRDTMQDTMADARGRAETAVAETRGRVKEAVAETRERVADVVEETQERLAETREKAGRAVREQAGVANQRLEQAVAGVPGDPRHVVEEYPWLVIVTVMLVGIMIGLLLRPGSD